MLKLVDGLRRGAHSQHEVSREELLRLWHQEAPRVPIREIAKRLGINESTVNRFARECGLSRGSPIKRPAEGEEHTGHQMVARTIPSLAELVPLRSLGQCP